MDTWPTTDLAAADWISVGTAASLAGVDPRTIRRWADEGYITARASPKGARKIDRASLQAAFERATVGRRRDPVTPDAKSGDPENAIRYLLTLVGVWERWDADHLDEKRCEALMLAIGQVRVGLDDVERAVRGRQDRLDNADAL